MKNPKLFEQSGDAIAELDKPAAPSENNRRSSPGVELDRLLKAKPTSSADAAETMPLPSVVIGEILAVTEGGCTPLVIYPGQPGTAALRARSLLDIQGQHVGRQAVLTFENANPSLPIVMGVLREQGDHPLDAPGQVEIDRDGERMIVNAKEQLVLQCGKASITLTRAGKVLINGAYVSSRSSGVNRLKGGSIQLN
jgi:hypothetical protein